MARALKCSACWDGVILASVVMASRRPAEGLTAPRLLAVADDGGAKAGELPLLVQPAIMDAASATPRAGANRLEIFIFQLRFVTC